jgi:hypothetical protein
MIDEKIPRQRSDPSLKGSFYGIKRCEISINFEENILRQIFRILRRTGKAVAQAIDTAMVRFHKFGPGERISIETALHHKLPFYFQRLLRHPLGN